ncbi:MAG TPA: BTAD domain-containing putative transcriptional regulator [Acidimicrobiales bacterium]|nr:BTAD domain-containing putative transcriptional regulator [Acidimicrobiales bacterium]
MSLLDGFEARHGEATVDLPPAAQRLVAYLALQPRPVLRIRVAGALWPESTDDKAAACLRSTLWRVGRSVGLTEATTTHVRLAPHVVVDVPGAAAHARRLVDGTAGDDELHDPSSCLNLLPDWYDDWVTIERERLRQLGLHALEALCLRLATCGRYGEAVDAGMRAVAAEPLRQSAQRALIRAHQAEGNHSEAVRQYDRYRALLLDSLGVEPMFRLEEPIGAAP